MKNKLLKLLSLAMTLTLTTMTVSTAYAIEGDNFSNIGIERTILDRYSSSNKGGEDEAVSKAYRNADGSSTVKILSVSYYDDDDNLVKEYTGDAALKHLIEEELENRLSVENGNVTGERVKTSNVRIVKTEETNQQDKQLKKFSGGDSTGKVRDYICDLSSMFHPKLLTAIMATLKFSIPTEKVIETKGACVTCHAKDVLFTKHYQVNMIANYYKESAFSEYKKCRLSLAVYADGDNNINEKMDFGLVSKHYGRLYAKDNEMKLIAVSYAHGGDRIYKDWHYRGKQIKVSDAFDEAYDRLVDEGYLD